MIDPVFYIAETPGSNLRDGEVLAILLILLLLLVLFVGGVIVGAQGFYRRGAGRHDSWQATLAPVVGVLEVLFAVVAPAVFVIPIAVHIAAYIFGRSDGGTPDSTVKPRRGPVPGSRHFDR